MHELNDALLDEFFVVGNADEFLLSLLLACLCKPVPSFFFHEKTPFAAPKSVKKRPPFFVRIDYAWLVCSLACFSSRALCLGRALWYVSRYRLRML